MTLKIKRRSEYSINKIKASSIPVYLLIIILCLSTISTVINSRPDNNENVERLSFNGIQSKIIFETNETGETIITTWPKNLPSALSFTFDDATPNQGKIGAPELTKRGMVGTFFLSICDVTDWQLWQNASNWGHELGSHSVNHVDLTKQNESDMDYELRESKRIIEENVTNSDVITFCYPLGAYNNTVINYTKQYYIAARRVWSTPYNPPDITWLFEVRPSYFFEATPAETMNDYINQSISASGWAIPMIHAIGNSTDGYEPIPVDNLTAHFNFVKLKRDEGEVWVDTFKNVSKYIAERHNTTVEYNADCCSGSITVNISTTLNESIYDQPLTLRTKLFDNWNSVYMKYENGTIIQLDLVIENGSKYAYYQVPHENSSYRLTEVPLPLVLSYSNEMGFTDTFFQPEYGNSQQEFTFKINVVSPDEIGLVQLVGGNPEAVPTITFDLNGDGDTNDIVSGVGEGMHAMIQEDTNDNMYADGKIFNYVSTFPPGAKVQFRIEAKDIYSRNYSRPYNSSNFIAGPEINNKPPEVHSFFVQNLHSKTPLLIWDCNSDLDGEPITFAISIGSAPNSSDILAEDNLTSKYLVISDQLEFHTSYYVNLCSVDQRNLHSDWTYYNFKLVNGPPNKPINLRVESEKTLTPKFIWDDVTDPDGDPVRYSLKGYIEDTIVFSEDDMTENTFTITEPLPDNSKVKVDIIAMDNYNESSVNTSTFFHFNIPPSRITNISAKSSESVPLSIEISWEPSSSSDWKSYKIYRSPEPFSELNLKTSMISELSNYQQIKNYTDTNLMENKLYYYTVVPVDSNNEYFNNELTVVSSIPSKDTSVPPPQPPPPLTGVKAKDLPNASNSILLSWDPSKVPKLDSYRIYRSNKPFPLLTSDIVLVNTYNKSITTEYIDYGVENNITYFYAVSAISTDGLENTSSFELAWAVSIDDIVTIINDTKEDPEPQINKTEDDDNKTVPENKTEPGDDDNDDVLKDETKDEPEEGGSEEKSSLEKAYFALWIITLIILIIIMLLFIQSKKPEYFNFIKQAKEEKKDVGRKESRS